MSEHKDLTGASLHEPKGADIATVGQVYVADGSGSGVWTNSLANASNIKIERVLDGASTAASQEPAALDTALQLEFGPAVNSTSDPAMLSSAGALTINEAGTYRLKISAAVGRVGGSGTSEVYLRALIGGTQVGQSLHFKLSSSSVYMPILDEAWLTLPAGTVITYEILRDSSGNNSGGLFQGMPTPADWNDNPSAAIRLERWIA